MKIYKYGKNVRSSEGDFIYCMNYLPTINVLDL